MERTIAKKIRLDAALLERGLVTSRARGEVLIREKNVTIDGEVVTMKSRLVDDENEIALLRPDMAWVSRAALKLEHALTHWKVIPKGMTVLDVGASTGGFTQVLLSRGAKMVYALDVGHGQLDSTLKNDARVINMEGVHINDVTLADFDKKRVAMIVVDVSFISLEKVLPKAKELLRKDGMLIALIKPQFEVGKKLIKKGIVVDPKLHTEVARQIETFVEKLGFTVLGVIASPILGGDGNKEFLIYAQYGIPKVVEYTQ